jgi:hypothetical protein
MGGVSPSKTPTRTGQHHHLFFSPARFLFTSLRFPGGHGASKGPGAVRGAVASLRRPARGAASHGREGVLLPPGTPGEGRRLLPSSLS